MNNFFEIHGQIMNDYREFIDSFIFISNDKLNSFVRNALNDNKFWQEPLIQFNPAYELGKTLNEINPKDNLHPDMKSVFPFPLYKHQIEAIEKGLNDKDFIVTSGTGSGKSVAYLSVIFNHILMQNLKENIQAIIVYPMNALINSQEEEIGKYKRNYEERTGDVFPIRTAKYTGQEKENERQHIRNSPPSILLTNYMMLELILTRPQEAILRNNIYKNLKYLVFDELHTYRGRQGADIALLIRRIKELSLRNIICIGTSATMASGDSASEKKKIIAHFAATIFGKSFEESQIICEYLKKNFETAEYNEQSLRESLEKGMKEGFFTGESYQQIGSWLENNIALDINEGLLIRQKPLTLTDINKKLSNAINSDSEETNNSLKQFLTELSQYNKETGKSILPYKIHQFISQTGLLHATLDYEYLTLEPQRTWGPEKKPILPIVFSRFSGVEFFCVRLDNTTSMILTRDFDDVSGHDDYSDGYIIPIKNAWNPEEIETYLPDSWFSEIKSGKKIKNDKKMYVPREINFSVKGQYDFDNLLEYTGWFVPVRFLFDPTSGTIFDSRTSEMTKLARLGSEGRSTSTTILSFSALKNLLNLDFPDEEKKIMSFTDNRQDASLQSGHFNDFYHTIRLRGAIYRALSKYREANYSKIDKYIFEALGLGLNEYFEKPDVFPAVKNQIDQTLRIFLMYKIIADLRRSWRVVLPNLEQCGLLRIKYNLLDENCEYESMWKDPLFWDYFSLEERKVITYDILDFFRKSYALFNTEFLSPDAIEKHTRQIREKLKDPWSIEENDKIQEPSYILYETIDKRNNEYLVSAGYQSGLGNYLKNLLKEKGVKTNKDEYKLIIGRIFDIFEKADWIKSFTFYNKAKEAIKGYQLKLDSIIWSIDDSDEYTLDKIKQHSSKSISMRTNSYFKKLYKQDFRHTFRAKEHTGQINNENREIREQQFKKGEISALFCSPTMELGIDISTLNIVHMRNVPPNPSNYAQRSGRAGRSGSAALIFTSCSTYSPHDRHYYHNSADMVAGKVHVPTIDLSNKEMLQTHLQAMLLSKSSIPLNNDLFELFDPAMIPSLQIKGEIKSSLTLPLVDKVSVKETFVKIVRSIDENQTELSECWINQIIENFPKQFERALTRWQQMYVYAFEQLIETQRIMREGVSKQNSIEWNQARRVEQQTKTQIDNLRNKDTKNGYSEFYPYRYLASEGFLPGYNFTRLPIRTFVTNGYEGEYISRPRSIALREFGPGNMIYHEGNKYRVKKLSIFDVENKIEQARVCNQSGYMFIRQDSCLNNCPITKTILSSENLISICNLITMGETYSELTQRISCEEEIRTAQGYDIQSYFATPDTPESVKEIHIKKDDEILIKLHYIPTANIYHVNHRWLYNRESDGFIIDLASGIWKSQTDVEENTKKENKSNYKTIKLYTNTTADAIYLQPMRALNLDKNGIITLQFALKKAVESYFNAEQNEIGSTLMGMTDKPNILIYEAAEGSLGILSSLSKNAALFKGIILEAIKVCRFEEETELAATYDDLLSYYNQRFHSMIDRFAIKEVLNVLLNCQAEIQSSTSFTSYDEQYKYLLSHLDENSSTERKFIDYLYKNSLKLPDVAQKTINEIYCKPDFFYKPDKVVFCDGTPHDRNDVKENDIKQRRALQNQGYDVIVYNYRDKLEDLVYKRSDIFIKIKN